jgi:hypothetical protein
MIHLGFLSPLFPRLGLHSQGSSSQSSCTYETLGKLSTIDSPFALILLSLFPAIWSYINDVIQFFDTPPLIGMLFISSASLLLSIIHWPSPQDSDVIYERSFCFYSLSLSHSKLFLTRSPSENDVQITFLPRISWNIVFVRIALVITFLTKANKAFQSYGKNFLLKNSIYCDRMIIADISSSDDTKTVWIIYNLKSFIINSTVCFTNLGKRNLLYGGSILSLVQFLQLASCLKKLQLASKVVKNDSKITLFLPCDQIPWKLRVWDKFWKHLSVNVLNIFFLRLLDSVTLFLRKANLISLSSFLSICYIPIKSTLGPWLT